MRIYQEIGEFFSTCLDEKKITSRKIKTNVNKDNFSFSVKISFVKIINN